MIGRPYWSWCLAALLALAACGDEGASLSGGEDDVTLPPAEDVAEDVAPQDEDPGPQPSDALADGVAEDIADDVEQDIGHLDDATEEEVEDIEDPADSEGDAQEDAAPPDVAEPPVDCPSSLDFDYSCDVRDPQSCPSGICLLGLCLGPTVDPERWASCGDGVCEPCETERTCPADCAPPPALDRPLAWDPATTLTVQVHGFRSVRESDVESQIYGEPRSAGGIGRAMQPFLDGIPDGTREPEAPNQLIGVNYYGATPAPWITGPEAAQIQRFRRNSPQSVHRYALIVAKFVRHRMALSGATHVRFVCHSMGCHVIRYLIEHDLEGLASEGRVVRWATIAGVIAGARLARLYDNPTVRTIGDEIGLNTADFVHMHPDYVMDHIARWDHRPYAANNPNFTGIRMHHVLGSDPRLSDTRNLIRLLDLNNPGDEPNDGIVYTLDQHFHEQAEPVRARDVAGRAHLPSTSALYLEHFDVSDAEGSGVMAAALLFHHRQVRVTLRRAHVHDDLERRNAFDFARQGDSPGELVAAVRVSYPWVQQLLGRTVIVHETAVDHRTPDLRIVRQGEVNELDLVLFDGPVFDAMDAIRMDVRLQEVDCYLRFDIDEWCLPPSPSEFLRFQGEVSLENQVLVWENARIRAEVEVEVFSFDPR